MINLIITKDGTRMINLGKTSMLEAKPNPMDAGKWDIVATQDGLTYPLATYTTKEQAVAVIRDIAIWNNNNYYIEREYILPEDDPHWDGHVKLFGEQTKELHKNQTREPAKDIPKEKSEKSASKRPPVPPMDEDLKQLILSKKKYKKFCILEKPYQFNELFHGKDYEIVQVHSAETYSTPKGKDIYGFCGRFSWIEGKLSPLDADSYSKEMTVYGYKEFELEKGKIGLDILVGNDW